MTTKQKTQETVTDVTVASVTVVSDDSVVNDTFNAHDVAIKLQEITDKANKSIAKELYAVLVNVDESKSAREIAREWLELPNTNAPKDNVESLTEWLVTQAMAYRVFAVLNANKATGERTTFEKCVKALNNGTNKNGITKAFAKSCKVGDELPANLKLSESETASATSRNTKSLEQKIDTDLDNLVKHLVMGDLDTFAYVSMKLSVRMKDAKAILESNATALK
jgi:hypothetical protein